MPTLITKPTIFFSLPHELRQIILVHAHDSPLIFKHLHTWWFYHCRKVVRVGEEERIHDWIGVLRKVDERIIEDVDFAAGKWLDMLNLWIRKVKEPWK